MPRKTVVEEIQNEKPVTNSQVTVRRSNRLVAGSNGNPVAQRTSPTTESNLPARVTRSRRPSAQDPEEKVENKLATRTRIASIQAEEEQKKEPSTPTRRGRRPSVTKDLEDQEETAKPKSVRSRRGSNVSTGENDENPNKTAAVRTRRSSATLELEPAVSRTPTRVTRRRSLSIEITAGEEVSTPSKRTTRGKKASDPEEVIEEIPKSVTRRLRRGSTDSLTLDTAPSTPSRRTTRRSSVNQEKDIAKDKENEDNNSEISPVIKKDVSIKITPLKKRKIIEQVEAELDLSIINESVGDDEKSKTEEFELNDSKKELKSKEENKQSPTVSPLSTANENKTPLKKSLRLSEKKSPLNKGSPTKEGNSTSTSKILFNQEIEKASFVSLGSDDSFKFHLSAVTLPETTQNPEKIEEQLNASAEILENQVKFIQEPKVVNARVSNVFKPNQKEFSFMEPMEVDETIINNSVMDKSVALNETSVVNVKNDSSVEIIQEIPDSTSNDEDNGLMMENPEKSLNSSGEPSSTEDIKDGLASESSENANNDKVQLVQDTNNLEENIQTTENVINQDDTNQDLTSQVVNKSPTECSFLLELTEESVEAPEKSQEFNESSAVFDVDQSESTMNDSIKKTNLENKNLLNEVERQFDSSKANNTDVEKSVVVYEETEESLPFNIISPKKVVDFTNNENSNIINETVEKVKNVLLENSSSPLDTVRKLKSPQVREKSSQTDKLNSSEIEENSTVSQKQEEESLADDNEDHTEVDKESSKGLVKEVDVELNEEKEEDENIEIMNVTSVAKDSKHSKTDTSLSKMVDQKDSKAKSRPTLDEFASAKLSEYLKSKAKEVEDSSSDEEMAEEQEEEQEEDESEKEYSEFIDGMAEEGEEDTPSEDSNQIIDEGESVGFSDSEQELSDDEYDKNDSFLCDEEQTDLLSGEEYDLGNEKNKKKKSRIINLDELEDEDIIKVPKKKEQEKPKRKSRIITVSDSSSEDEICLQIACDDKDKTEDESSEKQKTSKQESVIFIEDSQEEEAVIENDEKSIKSTIEDNIIKNQPYDENLSIDVEASKIIIDDQTKKEDSINAISSEHSFTEETTKKNEEVIQTRNSLLNQSFQKHRKSSLSIEENIIVDGVKDPMIKERINFLVDSFCSTVQKGQVSLNLSLEFEDLPADTNTTEGLHILSNIKIQPPINVNDEKQEEILENQKEEILVAGPSDENQKEDIPIVDVNQIEDIQVAGPFGEKQEIEEANQVDLRTVLNKKVKHKRKLSKSFSEVYEENKKAKKLKKNNGNEKLRPDLTEHLGIGSFGLMNQLITDVKNRPRRTIKPSCTSDNSWKTTRESNLKPSTSALVVKEKAKINVTKLHPKDFKNQMLMDTKRVKRVETKTLLKKKGVFK